MYTTYSDQRDFVVECSGEEILNLRWEFSEHVNDDGSSYIEHDELFFELLDERYEWLADVLSELDEFPDVATRVLERLLERENQESISLEELCALIKSAAAQGGVRRLVFQNPSEVMEFLRKTDPKKFVRVVVEVKEEELLHKFTQKMRENGFVDLLTTL